MGYQLDLTDCIRMDEATFALTSKREINTNYNSHKLS